MDDLYREFIIDHYRNPRNYGKLEDPDISYAEDNPVCGDHIQIDLKVNDGRISDVRFSGHGCAISQASASMLTEELMGLTLEEAKGISKEDILEMLGIPLGPVRVKCALLSLKVLKAGLYGLHGEVPEEEEENHEAFF
jgi:nitrogen fixation NifU-like protein